MGLIVETLQWMGTAQLFVSILLKKDKQDKHTWIYISNKLSHIISVDGFGGAHFKDHWFWDSIVWRG